MSTVPENTPQFSPFLLPAPDQLISDPELAAKVLENYADSVISPGIVHPGVLGLIHSANRIAALSDNSVLADVTVSASTIPTAFSQGLINTDTLRIHLECIESEDRVLKSVSSFERGVIDDIIDQHAHGLLYGKAFTDVDAQQRQYDLEKANADSEYGATDNEDSAAHALLKALRSSIHGHHHIKLRIARFAKLELIVPAVSGKTLFENPALAKLALRHYYFLYDLSQEAPIDTRPDGEEAQQIYLAKFRITQWAFANILSVLGD